MVELYSQCIEYLKGYFPDDPREYGATAALLTRPSGWCHQPRPSRRVNRRHRHHARARAGRRVLRTPLAQRPRHLLQLEDELAQLPPSS